MRTQRSVLLFIVLSLSLVILIRISRMIRQQHAAQSFEKATEKRVMPVTSSAVDLLNGARDFLWVEEGMVRGLKDVHVHVDPDIRRVLFSAAGAARKCHLAVISPNVAGQTIPAPTPVLNSFELPLGVLIVIEHPQAGDWTLQVEAKDNVQLSARAASAIGFDTVDLATAQPKAGQPARIKARLRAPDIARLEFRLIAKDGTVLARQAARPLSTDKAPTPGQRQYEYQSVFKTPPADFRLVADGQDSQGVAFRRVFPTVYQPVR